jgi:transcription initiation factor TFIID subunit 9B
MDAQTNGAAAPPSPQPAQSLPTPPPAPLLSNPTISTQLPGYDKRPRDARLIHLLLTSLGVSAYQERVPLQLLDFAYRHTSALLADALHLSSDAYISQQNRAKDPAPGGAMRDADGQVSMSAVQLAIQSRLQYQLGSGGMSKEFLMEVAEQRNKIRLPVSGQTEWGVRLPSEKFVLTGVPWGVKEVWAKEEEEEEEKEEDKDAMGDVKMEDKAEEEGPGFGDEVEGGTFEDVFGVEGEGEDEEMGDGA